MKILISAGEASGEMYGAQLIESLRRATAHVGTDALVRPSSAARLFEAPPNVSSIHD